MLKFARQMLEDWAVGSQARKMDEWLRAKRQLPDYRMGIVVALVTHQRHELSASFSCDFLIPEKVFIRHPMICPTLEDVLATMHKNNQQLAITGSLPWLFTLQAFIRPPLYDRGVDVWKQLQRGMPYVQKSIADMGEAGSQLNMTGFDEVPNGFDP